jgi:hypothetical protein
MAREKHPQALGEKCAKHGTYLSARLSGSPGGKKSAQIFFQFWFAA